MRHRALALGTALAGALLACAPAAEREPAPEEPLVLYSGRSESLLEPLIEELERELGVAVQVRYAGTAELVATLLEEGDATPAHVFLSQDAAALGALSVAGRLAPLAPEILGRVPEAYRSAAGDWVGVSGRVRSVVYNPSLISPDELPQTLAEVVDPRFRGRFGVAPTNASFQAHLAVYRALAGGAELDRLLAGMVANKPGRYPRNSAIVEAVIAGEIEWGLVNHYYLLRALAETPGAPGANFFMPEGQASTFVNLAGAAVLRPRPHPAAERLVAALLGEPAQRYFAAETFEYPLVEGVPAAATLPPLARLGAGQVPFAEVAAVLEETLEKIAASGLL